MTPGTQDTGTPPTDLDRKIEQHLLALKLTEAEQNGALYFNLARMADYRNDKAERPCGATSDHWRRSRR